MRSEYWANLMVLILSAAVLGISAHFIHHMWMWCTLAAITNFLLAWICRETDQHRHLEINAIESLTHLRLTSITTGLLLLAAAVVTGFYSALSLVFAVCFCIGAFICILSNAFEIEKNEPDHMGLGLSVSLPFFGLFLAPIIFWDDNHS